MVSNDLLLIPGKIEINIINVNDYKKIRKLIFLKQIIEEEFVY